VDRLGRDRGRENGGDKLGKIINNKKHMLLNGTNHYVSRHVVLVCG